MLPSRTGPVITFAAAALVGGLLSACSGEEAGGAGQGTVPDAAAYDTETLLPAVREAVDAQGSVHLGIGDRTPPSDIEVDIGWGETEEFRAVIGTDPQRTLEVLAVGGRAYVGGAAAGQEWRYLDLDDPRLTGEGDPDFDAGVVPILLDIDVPADYAAMEGAVVEAAHEGNEELDGVDAEHYTLTVDAQEWQAALPENSMHGEMRVADTVEMELWIDQDSLPVRWSYVGQGAADTARVDYRDWGTPVTVAEPEDAQPAD